MKTKLFFIACVMLFFSEANFAQVSMGNLSAPTQISNPLNGISVNYQLFGSKFGIGAASAQMQFYLSQSTDGSTGIFLLYDSQISLRGNGLGPYLPQSGIQTTFISRFGMAANTVNFLENACLSGNWYILGRIDNTVLSNDQISFTSNVLPDFKFASGSLSPVSIPEGGTINIQFAIQTTCSSPNVSDVGVYLANENQEPIAFLGSLPIGSGSGVFSSGTIPITFSPLLENGSYHIILVADLNNNVTESNEQNNIAGFRFTITAAANASIALSKIENQGITSLKKTSFATLGVLQNPIFATLSKPFDYDNLTTITDLSTPLVSKDIIIYASKNYLKFEFPNPDWDQSIIKVYNESGVLLGERNHKTKVIETIPIKGVASSFYIVKITGRKGTYSKKIHTK